jgi:hypothetical protein
LKFSLEMKLEKKSVISDLFMQLTLMFKIQFRMISLKLKLISYLVTIDDGNFC